LIFSVQTNTNSHTGSSSVDRVTWPSECSSGQWSKR